MMATAVSRMRSAIGMVEPARSIGHGDMSSPKASSVEMVISVLIFIMRRSDYKTTTTTITIRPETPDIRTFVRTGAVVTACASSKKKGQRCSSGAQKFSVCFHRLFLTFC